MIKVKSLSFAYPKSKQNTLKGINFEVKKGEIFGFLGPSGAGKSTTQKILINLLKDYQGNVSVMNKEIRDWGNKFYEKVGISFELPNLYNKLTGVENLKFISSFYDNKTENPVDLLKLVGLEDKGNIKVSQYSKGMKMRLNFIRSLIHNPELIFLDEPTTGLDPVNAQNIKNIILKKKSEGKTIFLTTHNMNVADELCDRVAFIVDGEIKLIDSPKDLKVKKGKPIVTVGYYENNIMKYKEFELNNLGYNKEFFEFLRNNEARTIHTKEATLEDIFIETTGRSLL